MLTIGFVLSHIRVSSLSTFPVHFDFSFRESSLSHTFTLKSSPGLLFQSIHDGFCLTDRIFLVPLTMSLSTGIFSFESTLCCSFPQLLTTLDSPTCCSSPATPYIQHLPRIYDTQGCWLLLAAACSWLLMDRGTKGIRTVCFLYKQ